MPFIISVSGKSNSNPVKIPEYLSYYEEVKVVECATNCYL